MGVHFSTQFRNPLAYPAGYAPGFDPSHLAAHRAQCSVIAGPGNAFVDIMSGKVSTQTGTGALNFVIDGNLGQCVQGAGGGSTILNQISGYLSGIGNTNFTLAAIIRAPASYPAGAEAIIGLGASADNAGFYIRHEGTTGNLRLICPSGTSVAATSLAPTVGQPYFLVVSNGISTGINTVNYLIKNLNSGQISTTTSTAGVPTAGSGVVSIMGESGRQFEGKMAAGMVSLNYMSMIQLQQWADDPWSFWYPNPGDNWIAAQAAAAFPYWAVQNNNFVIGSGVQ